MLTPASHFRDLLPLVMAPSAVTLEAQGRQQLSA